MSRDLKLDSLKGFLIILVIIGHTPFEYFNVEKIDSIGYFSQWFYFFHMPLFFAISVLFIKNDFSWIVKRASLILIPYFFWFFYGHKKLLLENPLEFMGGVSMGNWESLNSIIWFLPALFTLNVLFYIFYKSNSNSKYFLFGLSFIVFLFANKIVNYHSIIPFGLDVAMYIFTLAFIVQKIYQNQEKLSNVNYVYVFLAISVSSYGIFELEPLKTHTQYHAIIDLAQFSVATTFIGYLSFLLLNSSLFVLFLKIKSVKTFEILGKYSLPIFLLHLMVLYKLPNYVTFDNSLAKISFLFLAIGLSLVLPIVVSKSLMKISDKFKYIGMTK